MAVGYVVRGPDGCSGGIRGHGGSDASAAGGYERGVSLGVRSAMREMERMVEGDESGV